MSDSHDVPKKQAEAVQGDLVMLTTPEGARQKIRLTALCILYARKRAAGMGCNPATGEAIKIKASKKIASQGIEGNGCAGLSLDKMRVPR